MLSLYRKDLEEGSNKRRPSETECMVRRPLGAEHFDSPPFEHQRQEKHSHWLHCRKVTKNAQILGENFGKINNRLAAHDAPD